MLSYQAYIAIQLIPPWLVWCLFGLLTLCSGIIPKGSCWRKARDVVVDGLCYLFERFLPKLNKRGRAYLETTVLFFLGNVISLSYVYLLVETHTCDTKRS